MKKLAIISTHPIQYNAPWFKLLAQRKKIQLKVFYTWSQSKQGAKYDPGFAKTIEWDLPLFEGYDFTFVKNISKKPGTRSFKGIINPTLISEVNAWAPDSLLIFGWNFQSHLKCLIHFHKKKAILFRGDSTLLKEKLGIKKIIRTIFLKWVYKHIDYALYVGYYNKLYFLRHNVKEKQLFFAPHAVDNDRFSEPKSYYEGEAEKWKLNLNINKDKLIILFAGKFEEVKNPKIIIEAANDIFDQNIHFILVGNGSLEKDLKQLSNKNNITFIDFKNQRIMPTVYRLGDVFLLSSKSETWGLSINEAMACGLPVIVSNACGCAADLVEEGKNGYIFQSGNKDDLVQKIKLVKEKKSQLKIMGRFSQQKIEGWSFEKIAQQIENIVLTN